MTAAGETQRQRLLDMIRADPGIHVQRLARLVGIGWTTCEHHLRALEVKGLITRKRLNGRCRVFATGSMAAPHHAAAGLLLAERNSRIAAAVAGRPGTCQRRLSRDTGIPPSSLCRRLQEMSRFGLIERIEDGRELRVFPTPALAATLRELDAATVSLAEVNA